MRCNMNNQPIGFIDSGVGGLSVVKEVMKVLPNEQLYFVGDTQRNPYGSRPLNEVKIFSQQLANFLQTKKIKLLVIACNTATAAALEDLQTELDIPVIGVIEPGSKSAVATTKNNTIGVIGTEGTIHSREYNKKIKQLNKSTLIKSVACQPFVEIVEEDNLSPKEITTVVSNSLNAFDQVNMDTLILGCTHFPLIESYIRDYFDEQITLINPGVETAHLVQQTLIKEHLLNEEDSQPKEHIFYTTGSVEKFKEISNKWLDNKNFRVESLSLKELID